MCNVKYVINFNNGVSSATSSRFATGMNGDEDLGQDISMKGEPYHYRGEVDKFKPDYKSYTPNFDDYGLGYVGYARVVPAPFAGDNTDYPVDTFTQKFINDYAVEEDKVGLTNGTFVPTKEGVKAAALEYLQTTKEISRADAEKYVDEKFEDVWNYYDVNKEGEIEVVQMPQFMRFLAKQVEVGYDLQ